MAILNARKRPAARRGIVLPAAAAAAITVCVAAAQPAAPVIPRQGSCWADGDGDPFRGSSTVSQVGGRTVIHERTGRLADEVVVQRSFGNLRVCARAEGLRDDDDALPSSWAGRARRMVLETEQPGDVRRMVIAGGQATLTVNGARRGVDAAAQAWQSRLLALLDATWELSQLRGRVSSLRGEIASIHGARSSLHGEISSLRGEVSSMRGRIASLRGEESSLRGRIASIRGHLSSLQGQISSEQGAISSLTASARTQSGDSERINRRVAQHRDAIRELEEEIRRYDVEGRVRAAEREIAALDVDRQVAAIERQIAEVDVESRIAAVNRRIAALRVDESVAGVERQIAALDADRRGRALEARVEEALERLRTEMRNR